MNPRKRTPPKWPISLEGEKKRNKQKPVVTVHRQTRWANGTVSRVETSPKRRAMPRIRAILAIFEPIILPIIKPGESLFKADIEVNNSGVDVAIDTMVKPTTTGGTPS